MLRQSILFMSGRSRGRGGRGCDRGCGGVQPGSNVVAPSRPKIRSHGGGDGYMHEEVDIALDGENGNEYGITEEPETDARPAQGNEEAHKKKRSKKSKKRSKNRKPKHSSSDFDSDSSSSSTSSSSSSSSSSDSDTDSDSVYHRKNKSKKKFKVKLTSKHIPNLNDKRSSAKERHDRLVELNKTLHRAHKHAESNLDDVQKESAPHKTAKKVVAEIQGVLRVLEKQSNHLFFGATYGWDKFDRTKPQSSSTKKFAKKLGVKAGDVSKAPVPFLPKHRPPFTTQTLNHSMPQQHYNAPLHPAPTFQQSFSMPPPAPPPYVNGHAGGNRSGPPYASGARTHGHNQSAANGFRRPGYNGYNKFNGTPR